MQQDKVLVRIQDGMAWLTVNRPQVHNALDRESWAMLRRAIGELEENRDVKVILITGAGEKAFVAGADVGALRERSVLETLEGENGRVTLAIEQCTKPTIAVINGLALGGGCEIALACDLRIAAAHAKFGQTELNVGILPGAGGTQRLTRLVGVGRAMQMILTGEPISAETALQWGLVGAVVPGQQLMDEAVRLAEKLMKKSPLVLRLAKAAVREGAKTDLSAGLFLETLCQSIVFGTEDHTEGLTAFLEKRPPVYRGE